jgi:hypothetical protein
MQVTRVIREERADRFCTPQRTPNPSMTPQVSRSSNKPSTMKRPVVGRPGHGCRAGGDPSAIPELAPAIRCHVTTVTLAGAPTSVWRKRQRFGVREDGSEFDTVWNGTRLYRELLASGRASTSAPNDAPNILPTWPAVRRAALRAARAPTAPVRAAPPHRGVFVQALPTRRATVMDGAARGN